MTYDPNGWTNGDAAARLEFPPERDSGEPTRPPLEIEWAHEVQPRDGSWIVKGILPDAGLAAFYGPSRAGKSFLAIDWGLRIACGEQVLSAKTRRAGVAYIAAEAANGVRKRICAWRRENDRDDDEFIPLALIGAAVDLTAPKAPDVAELIDLLDTARAEFREMGEPLGIVIVDTLARSMPGADENSSVDMGSALAALQRIADALHVLVLVVHHTGKDAARGARGHSSFFAALDTAVELSFDEDSGARSLKLVKQKDDEAGRSWGFELRPVEIGLDADATPISSCVIAYTDAPTSSKRRRDRARTPAERIVLAALKSVLSSAGMKPPAGVPAPPGAYVAPYAAVRQRAFETGLSQDSGTASAPRMRWNRALERLAADGVLRVWNRGEEGWLWL